jgi:glycosyltransferase involved in cell wall biosynthesis
MDTHEVKKFMLPVSLFQDSFSEKICRSKKDQPSFQRNDVLLTQVGSIHELKSSDAILQAFQKLSPNINLAFMGHISPNIRQLAESLTRKPAIYEIQPSFVQMRSIIAKADIGIIGAKEKNLNNYFYSMAAGQLVEFVRLGIPVIVADSEELGAFVEEQKCGKYIHEMAELEQSIDCIKSHYSEYSENCFRMYQEYFNLSNYCEKLVALLTCSAKTDKKEMK